MFALYSSVIPLYSCFVSAALEAVEVIELRNRTENISELLDWRNLGKAYANARSLALEWFYNPPIPIADSVVNKSGLDT